MKLDNQFFDNEIQQAEAQVANLHKQLAFTEGALTTLRQLRELAESTDAEPEDNAS